jgi:4-alpha-glucanotransferase
MAPGDVVGDLRQPNMPGTVEEYPSWRLPVADTEERPLMLEDLLDDARMSRLAAAFRAAVR